VWQDKWLLSQLQYQVACKPSRIPAKMRPQRTSVISLRLKTMKWTRSAWSLSVFYQLNYRPELVAGRTGLEPATAGLQSM